MALGLPHVTTTRHFPGVTPSAQRSGPFDEDARETLAGAGLDFSRLSYVRQVHGADVVAAPGPWRKKFGEARAESDDPLADGDYDVPTFLRRQAD